MLCYQGRLYIPNLDDLRDLMILSEAYNIQYSIHPRSTKMYRLKKGVLVEWHEGGHSKICGRMP